MSLSDDKIDKMLQSWRQMAVDRNLCEKLRLDSQKLREEFREEYRKRRKRRKRPYGESHPYNAFIPKRFEDLKPNGGIRFRKIPITLTYHKARFKKRKRRLLREKCDPSVTQKQEISTSSLRLGGKSVGMKKQYHQKKKTTQVKLAQACKSLEMFLDSPRFRDPKDCTKICVVKRQIVDTGVKQETHLFWYEYTSHAPMDIDDHVDTRIGDQSIFAEVVTAQEHDDPDAAMESLKDETVMESEPELASKYKSFIELSHVQHQKGQRGFHKVRFKVRRHVRNAIYTGRVVLQNKLSVNWSYNKTRKELLMRQKRNSFRFSRSVKKRVWWSMTTSRRKQLCEFSLVIQVWEPGGISTLDEACRILKKFRKSNFHGILQELSRVMEPGTLGEEYVSGGSLSDFAMILKKELSRVDAQNTKLKCVIEQEDIYVEDEGTLSTQAERSKKTMRGKLFGELFLASQVWEPGGEIVIPSPRNKRREENHIEKLYEGEKNYNLKVSVSENSRLSEQNTRKIDSEMCTTERMLQDTLKRDAEPLLTALESQEVDHVKMVYDMMMVEEFSVLVKQILILKQLHFMVVTSLVSLRVVQILLCAEIIGATIRGGLREESKLGLATRIVMEFSSELEVLNETRESVNELTETVVFIPKQ